MISARNTTLSSSNADQHDLAGRVEVPSYTSDRTGPEPLTASTVMSAVNLAEVMAERRQRLLSTAALVAASLQSLSIDTGADAPEEV